MGCGSSIHETVIERRSITNNHREFDYSHDGNNLPRPQPLTERREDLLRGKEGVMARSDEFAAGASQAAAFSNNINDFVHDQLMPPENQKIVTTKMVTSTTTNGIDSASVGSDEDSGVEDLPPGYGHDDVEEMIRKQKEIEEKAKLKKEREDKRRNMTLQQKLEERRQKRKAVSVARGTEAVSAEDVGTTERIINRKRVSMHEAEHIDLEYPANIETTFISAPVDIQAAAGDLIKVVSDEQAPIPVAPSVDKEVIYSNEANVEFFKDLEDFAVGLKTLTSPSVTFANLMEKLLINELSDLEKVRILFHWITAQNLNEISFPANLKEDTPLGFLFAIKNNLKSYAELFCRLCSAAGLHAMTIKGYLKGVGYMPDYVFQDPSVDKFRGSWNAVLINNQWRLIDTHWGARHVLEEDEKSEESWQTHYKYEEHYFLTDPDQLISSHFPENKEWQLLNNPLTIDQFQDNAKVWPLYYKLKLELSSHKKGVINAPESGFVEIVIKSSEFSRKDAILKCELKTRDRQVQVGGVKLENQVLHYFTKDEEKFLVHVPEPGKYLFKVFGLSNTYSEKDTFTNVCLYQINCKKVKAKKLKIRSLEDVQPEELQPPFPATSVWGYTKSAHGVGFPVGKTTPVINCDMEGEASMEWQVFRKSKDIRFTAQLVDSLGNVLPNRSVQYDSYVRGKKHVTFQLRTPGPGLFALKIFKKHESSSEMYEEFCRYIVSSYAQKEQKPIYPEVTNGDLGILSNDFSVIFKSVDSFEIDNNGNESRCDSAACWMSLSTGKMPAFAFKVKEPAVVVTHLQSEHFSSDKLKEYITTFNTRDQVVIYISIPRGFKDSEVLLNVFGSKLADNAQLPNVYKALISVPNMQKLQVFQLPPCPFQSWGVTGNFYEYSLQVNNFNCKPLLLEGLEDACCSYDSSDDFQFKVRSGNKMSYMIRLFHFTDGSWVPEADTTTFLESSEGENALFKARFKTIGFYHVDLYGNLTSSDSTTMKPIFFKLIRVTVPSKSPNQFPTMFPIWLSREVNLLWPKDGILRSNTENEIKVTLAKSIGPYKKSAYSKVVILTNNNSPVYPNQEEGCTYTWNYFPSPGETQITIAAAAKENNDFNYVLKLTVV